MLNKGVREGLLKICENGTSRVMFDEPLSEHSTIAIGGKVLVWMKVASTIDLVSVSRAFKSVGARSIVVGTDAQGRPLVLAVIPLQYLDPMAVAQLFGGSVVPGLGSVVGGTGYQPGSGYSQRTWPGRGSRTGYDSGEYQDYDSRRGSRQTYRPSTGSQYSRDYLRRPTGPTR